MFEGNLVPTSCHDMFFFSLDTMPSYFASCLWRCYHEKKESCYSRRRTVIGFLHPSYCFINTPSGTYIVWVIEGGLSVFIAYPWPNERDMKLVYWIYYSGSLFFSSHIDSPLLCLQCLLFPWVLGPNGPNEDRFRLNVTFTVPTIYPGGGGRSNLREMPLKKYFLLKFNILETIWSAHSW